MAWTAQRKWEPADPSKVDGLLFDASTNMLTELDALLRRPRRWWTERLVPIIYLVLDAAATSSPLDGLHDRLSKARPQRVLHSRVGAFAPDDGQAQPAGLRALLDSAVADLAHKVPGVRQLRFPHYALAVWLTTSLHGGGSNGGQDQGARQVDQMLRAFIVNRYRLHNEQTERVADLVDGFPWWVRSAVRAFGHVGVEVIRRAWRPPRWLAQHAIARPHQASFRRLALAVMNRAGHAPDVAAVQALLVDAFLEDLRRSYRRRTLLGFGRRRMAYPVLLVDGAVHDSVQLELVRLVVASRTRGRERRGRRIVPWRWDPLLLVAAGDRTGLERVNESPKIGRLRFAGDLGPAASDWRRAFAEFGVDRNWLLPVSVPSTVARDDPGAAGRETAIRVVGLPGGRRCVATLVVPVVLAAGAVFTVVEAHERCELPVGPQLLQRQELDAGRDQCVGLSTGGHRFFAGLSGVDGELAVALADVEEQIHAKNTEFGNKSGSVTVVYLSTLTSLDESMARTELEHLRGLAVAQVESGDARPVRILLANAGHDMRHAVFAAEAIKQEAARDPSIVAVVGLGISKKETGEAVIRLSNDVEPRMPMIAISLSATDLGKNTQYYHQVGPTNVREAAVAASYAAARLNAGTVTIYYSGDPDDLYSDDLRVQVEAAMVTRQIPVRSVSYRVGNSAGDVSIELAGRQACDVPPETGVVFYAGRAEVLPRFLAGMTSSCDGSYPRIIAGDSVTRFVLQDGLQNFPTLVIDYLSFASSLAWGSDCLAGYGRVGFFRQYDALFGEGSACDRTRDGHAIIAYDTVGVFRRAIQNVDADFLPAPAEVLGGIDDISTQASGPLSGASGTIDYPGSGERSVPADKAIMILRSIGGGAAGSPPTRQLLCGVHDTAVPEPDPGVCPTESVP
ncbi:MAG: hypothetical protein ACRDRH_10150 [Pseudonocardia sp.]